MDTMLKAKEDFKFDMIHKYIHQIMALSRRQEGITKLCLSAPLILCKYFTSKGYTSKIIVGYIKPTDERTAYVRHIWCETEGKNMESMFLKVDGKTAFEVETMTPLSFKGNIVHTELHEEAAGSLDLKSIIKHYLRGGVMEECLSRKNARDYNKLGELFLRNVSLYANGIFDPYTNHFNVTYTDKGAIVKFRNLIHRQIETTTIEPVRRLTHQPLNG